MFKNIKIGISGSYNSVIICSQSILLLSVIQYLDILIPVLIITLAVLFA